MTTSPNQAEATSGVSKPSEFWAVFLLSLFLGIFGVHRFYARKFKSGTFQLLTCGGLGIWSFIDVIVILLSKFKSSAGVLYQNPKPKVAWGIFAAVCILGFISAAADKESGGGGGGSSSSHSSSHKSARQLIRDYAQDHYGRNADVEIESGFAGGAFQVTVRTPISGGANDGGIQSNSYTVTVDESAQEITSWKMYDHN